MSDLAIIAGQGRLPEILRAAHPSAVVRGLHGFAPSGVDSFRIETLGTQLADLQNTGVRRLCLAGAVRRPQIDPARIDAATAPHVAKIAAAIGQGDDALLRAIIEIIESHGITVVGADTVCPDLLPPAGPLGRIAPSDAHQADAQRAFAVLDVMGAADVGQGCIVAQGQVIATETLPGTDWMLASLAAMRQPGALSAPVPQGGLIAKAPKPGQDRRVDLPAIGPGTAKRAAKAGLDGIVIAQGGVMVLDRAELIDRADAAGLFVWVRP